MNITNTASWFIVVTLVILALSFGQSIFVPFLVALFIWFVVKKARNMIDKINFVHKYIPKWIKTLIASFTVFGILLLTGKVLTQNIEQIARSYDSYVSNAEVISARISALLNFNVESEINDFLKKFDFSTYLRSLFNSISGILGNMMMIVFYAIFLFIEEGLFRYKMHLFFDNAERENKIRGVLIKIDKMLSRYIILKSLINFVTALIAYLIMYFVGLDSPFFWAALIFFFSFIPSIGPILGTFLPAIFSLIQFGEFTQFLIILLSIGAIQVAIGNYVEPRIMGNTLNISPLFAVFALAIWGSIWGITGMLLSVPITVAMIIVMAQFPSTRKVAILLSEKGKV